MNSLWRRSKTHSGFATPRRQLAGLKFDRRYPLIVEYFGQKRFFIADFYCHELKLVIEVDGGIHETQKQYDTLRTEIINQLKIKVIRFTNNDILTSLKLVLQSIAAQ